MRFLCEPSLISLMLYSFVTEKVESERVHSRSYSHTRLDGVGARRTLTSLKAVARWQTFFGIHLQWCHCSKLCLALNCAPQRCWIGIMFLSDWLCSHRVQLQNLILCSLLRVCVCMCTAEREIAAWSWRAHACSAIPKDNRHLHNWVN